jgi:hypothetical protein
MFGLHRIILEILDQAIEGGEADTYTEALAWWGSRSGERNVLPLAAPFDHYGRELTS